MFISIKVIKCLFFFVQLFARFVSWPVWPENGSIPVQKRPKKLNSHSRRLVPYCICFFNQGPDMRHVTALLICLANNYLIILREIIKYKLMILSNH